MLELRAPESLAKKCKDGEEETISWTFLHGMRADPAKREILGQRTRSPYLQEMCQETKGTTVRRDRSQSHLPRVSISKPLARQPADVGELLPQQKRANSFGGTGSNRDF